MSTLLIEFKSLESVSDVMQNRDVLWFSHIAVGWISRKSEHLEISVAAWGAERAQQLQK